MKVILINNVCGYGSTGNICVDISEYLIAQGHQCTIAYGHGNSDYPHAYKFGRTLENKLHSLFSKISGKEGYWSKRGTRDLIGFLKRENPDIIHLHSTFIYYLNLPLLFDYLKKFKGKIFWTIHDCSPFTGNCIYYSDVNCNKWETECGACPQISKPPVSWFFDKTRESFRDKAGFYEGLSGLTIIAVSKWLEGEIRRSMLGRAEIRQIYNWVRHDVFTPMDSRSEIVAAYGLHPEKKILLGVSGGNNGLNKLAHYVKLAEVIDHTTEQLVLVGRYPGKIPDTIKTIPYIHDPHSLAKIYNAADVYVHLSTEETFGLIIAEAMSCGTPTIVFNSTACPETLHSEECGAIVEKGNMDAVYSAIKNILSHPKGHYSGKCRDRVIEAYNYRKNVQKTLDLYEG